MEIQQTVARTAMEIALTPGSTRALVKDIRQVDYGRELSTVAFSYGQAKVSADSVQIVPPNGLSVKRSYRPAGKDNTLVWELEGRPQDNAPTVISYELDGIKWQPLYVLTYQQDAETPGRGSVSLQAEIEITNESGLEVESASFTVALVGSGENTSRLQVRGTALDLPPGWTKRWALVTATGSQYIQQNLLAQVRHVYDPSIYAQEVHRLVMIEADPGSLPGLYLLSLPEGPLDIFLAGTGEACDDLPAVVTTWRPRTEWKKVGGPLDCVLVDAGADPGISVVDTVMALRKEKLAVDKVGRISGMDIVEEHKLTLMNNSPRDVTMAVYQRLLSNWEIRPKPPAVKPPGDKKDAPIWVGPLSATGTATLEFTIIKHQGSNA